MKQTEVQVKLMYFELQTIINALSRDIIRLNNRVDLPELIVAIGTYKNLHEIVDKLWPDWLITNEEVQRILDEH